MTIGYIVSSEFENIFQDLAAAVRNPAAVLRVRCYRCYKREMKSKRPYHHGDLKRALLDAALELTRAVGSDGFTLRQVANIAGVSHTALYRHFRDKDELLAAVATEGYNPFGFPEKSVIR